MSTFAYIECGHQPDDTIQFMKKKTTNKLFLT